MQFIDFEILRIVKNKKKISKIKKMLNTAGQLRKDTITGKLIANFEQDNQEKYYNVHSLTSTDKIYKVYKSKTGWTCDCIYNYLYLPYREGMKKYGNSNYCIHILAIICYLSLI